MAAAGINSPWPHIHHTGIAPYPFTLSHHHSNSACHIYNLSIAPCPSPIVPNAVDRNSHFPGNVRIATEISLMKHFHPSCLPAARGVTVVQCRITTALVLQSSVTLYHNCSLRRSCCCWSSLISQQIIRCRWESLTHALSPCYCSVTLPNVTLV